MQPSCLKMNTLCDRIETTSNFFVSLLVPYICTKKKPLQKCKLIALILKIILFRNKKKRKKYILLFRIKIYWLLHISK